MAYISIKFNSYSLDRITGFELFIPNDGKRPSKTLFLLHGYTSGAWNWVPEELSRKYNTAIVAPNGENSFWLDGLSTGHKFCTLVGQEIPDYLSDTFGIAKSAEDTCVLGLSMGGFGALHTALAYPERFGKAGSMSGALIHREVAAMKPGSHNAKANYEYYRECFGEPDKLLGSANDPEALVKKLKNDGKRLPRIYMWGGTEDFLRGENRAFHSFLEENSVDHVYKESAGGHDMTFWNEYTAKIIEWMFSDEQD